MKRERLIEDISEKLSVKVESLVPVGGGSISSAYKLTTSDKAYFIKANSKADADQMFRTEKVGLQEIEASNTIAVPHVHLVGKAEGTAYILMDFVENRRPTGRDFVELGRDLAAIHLVEGEQFGFSTDNFIGSLPQSNQIHSSWADFYRKERIEPQLNMALNLGELTKSEIPGEEKMQERFEELLSDAKPVLLHGDLWGGNYLIAEDGTPVLIDPAVYYGHSMVDIAMSKLFGGFDREFYSAYHEIHPQSDYYEEQIDLYQLYYLLVHLNLFGRSYRASVVDILKRYF